MTFRRSSPWVAAFLAGDDIHFSLNTIRLDTCSSFQQKVLRAEHGIPRRSVSTYQRIARHVGNVKGARAVGTALATNPFPIIIPCHRAIRSNGTLGGYQGGLEMKRTLTNSERRSIAWLNTPPRIQGFLDKLTYSSDGTYRCPLRVLRERTGL